MEVQLISHASVVIRSDVVIWTDPWLFGKAFNDSWSLYPEPSVNESLYDEIDYIFISHEHPDHFHVPTLRALPDALKQRVTVLFQENNSRKVFDALNKFGFSQTLALPHAELVELTSETSVYCYQNGAMDSALGVVSSGEVLLNLNDCEINTKDCKRIVGSLGKISVVLNQFSIAGYSGYQDRDAHLPEQAKGVLQKVLSNHNDLKADVTIPFASFVYFSSDDNAYINDYANRPQDIYDLFVENGSRMVVLYPGDTYRLGEAHDSTNALERFRTAYRDDRYLHIDRANSVSLEEIRQAYLKLAVHLKDKYPQILLNRLDHVTVTIPDLNRTITFSIANGSFEEQPEADPDLLINSQPLHFAFAFPYGIQTLGVSARYTLLKNFSNWRKHRVLFALNNAELYLRPKYLLTKQNFSFFKQRLPGAVNQLSYRFKVMR